MKQKMQAVVIGALGSVLVLAIMAQAPMAIRSDGIQFPDGSVQTSAVSRALPLNVFGHLTGAAVTSTSGIRFPQDTDGAVYLTLLVPPGHEAAQEMFVDLVIEEDDFSACSIELNTQGLAVPVGASSSTFVNWIIPEQSGATATTLIDLPSEQDNHSLSFVLEPDTAFDEPGDALVFKVFRNADSGADSCGSMNLVAAQARY